MFRPLVSVDLSIDGYKAGYKAYVRFKVRVYETLTGRGIPYVPVDFKVDKEVYRSFSTDDKGLGYVDWETDKIGRYAFLAEVKYLGWLLKSGELEVGVSSIRLSGFRTYDASEISVDVSVDDVSFTTPTEIFAPCFGQRITVTFATQHGNLPFRLGEMAGSRQTSPMFVFAPEAGKTYDVKGYYGYIPTRIDLSMAERRIGYDSASIVLRGRLLDEVLDVGCPDYPYTLFVDASQYPGSTNMGGWFEGRLDLYEGAYTIYASAYTGRIDNKTLMSVKLPIRVCRTVFEVVDYHTGKTVSPVIPLPLTIMGVRVERPSFFIPYISGETARIELPSKHIVTDTYMEVNDRFMDLNIDGRVFDSNIVDFTLPISKIVARYARPRMFFLSLDKAWDEKVSQCIAVRAIGLKARLVALHGLRFKFKDYVTEYMDGLKDGVFEFPTVEAYVNSCLCGRYYTLFYVDGLLPEYYGGYMYNPMIDIIEDKTGRVVGNIRRVRAWWSSSPEVRDEASFSETRGYFELKLTKCVPSTLGGYLNYEFVISFLSWELDKVIP
jgi:hypothetical protein